MCKKKYREYISTICVFSLAIIAANVWYSGYGIAAEIPVILLLVPIDFVTRDKLHTSKLALFSAFSIGSVLSFLLADASVATASVLAFVLAFLSDTAIFSMSKSRVSSNVVASIVDTLVFAVIAVGSVQPVHFVSILLKVVGSIGYDFLLFRKK